MMISLGDTLRINAGKFPNRICISDGNRKLTFKEFNQRVNKIANGLTALGLGKGEKIAIFSRNCIEYMEVFHACAKIGVCLVTLNFWLRPSEIAVIFNHSDAVMIILGEQYQESIFPIYKELVKLHANGLIVIGNPKFPHWESYENILSKSSEEEVRIQVDWDDPFWLIYTSGTTGDPKGVLRSHRRTVLDCWLALIEFGLWKNDYFLAISPFFHGVTFFPLMVLQAGGEIYVVSEFNADNILKIMSNEKITASFMVPTVLDMMLNSKNIENTSFKSLRMLITGAAPLPTKTKEKVMEKIGPVLFEFYGATESGYVTVLHPEDQLRKIRCCGQQCFGAEIEIRDPNGNSLPPGQVGELFSKWPGRFDEYYRNPGKTAEALRDDWFTAGDLGMKDEENYYYIVDRKTDMIISGGENIYPREIEDILKSHSAVEECAVFGIPDEQWGEAVKAVIVLKPGYSISEQGIKEYCAVKLAGFKRPNAIEFVKELPKTASGKIMKRMLRDEHWKDRKIKV
jgi:long-chain acyl-CoA synthetase